MKTLRSSALVPFALTATLLCVSGVSASPALAVTQGTGWNAFSSAFPTNLPPGGSGKIQVDIIPTGAKPSEGSITVTDVLPPGLVATAAGGMPTLGTKIFTPKEEEEKFGGARWICGGTMIVTCTSNPTFLPHLPIGQGRELQLTERIGIAVKVEEGASGASPNRVTVAGGGASAATTVSNPMTVSVSQAAFGFTGWDVSFTNADGTPDTQAGSRPYSATFIFRLNELANSLPADGEVRNLETELPPGFFADPNAVARCTRSQLDGQQCPVQSQIGVDAVGRGGEGEAGTRVFFVQPVYNMVPPPGVPAEFAFSVLGFHSFLDAGVRSGNGYGIVEHIDNTPRVTLDENILTLWGVPAEPSHDTQRNADSNSIGGGHESCREGCPSGALPRAFLTLPTSCAGPQAFTIHGLGTWSDPSARAEASVRTHDSSGTETGLTGCERLSVEPSLSAVPDAGFADTPAGFTFDVKVPQDTLELPNALVASTIKNTTVTLPEGVVINPGQAAGLVACQPAEANVAGEGPQSCPAASKVGTVHIRTPLLEGELETELEGNIYVLQSNPPNLQLLLAASGDGIYLKLVGNVHLNEQTGQLTTTFSETPELPFTDLRLAFSGGAQAALDTPTACGTYTTTSDFTPWTTPFGEDLFPSSSFSIVSGPGGSACASPMPFSPSMSAGSTTDQAGAFTNFSLLLQRADGQQRVERLQFRAPAGLSGKISQVPLCDEANANAGTCPAGSHIGHAVVTSGPGPYPLVLPQPGAPELPIYLTGPYKGAPFGLSIVTPVIAGPFNLGTVVTRAKIEVDPQTAQITITTDPLPQIVKGVPTDLRSINSIIDRPGFMFNPTNCNPQAFSGTATSAGGAANAPLVDRFQVLSCRELPFKPSFTVATQGNGNFHGASLDVKIAEKPGEANIHKVDVQLPTALPSRLTTLQKACPEGQFAANPAGCPDGSVVGVATAITPVLKVPLTGAAYLVSHGGAAFPDLDIVLQGEGVKILLTGNTDIKKGITYSRFDTAPDAPISSFELNLPEGPHSALGAIKNLCALTKTTTTTRRVTRRIHGHVRHVIVKVKKLTPEPLLMPTTITGQNGAVETQTTKIAVTGCAKAKPQARKAKAKKTRKAHKSKHK